MGKASQPKQPLALVVDDDITMRIAMCQVLENVGITAIEAGDGDEALTLFAAHHPDVVILDIEMPVKDGLTACAEIRQMPEGRWVPILMSTGMDDETSIIKAYEVGATDFIVKPINWPLMGYRIQYMLRATKAIEDYRQTEILASRLGKVVESSSNEICVVQCESLMVQQVNASARRNLGYSDDELQALTLPNLFPEMSKERITQLFTHSRADDNGEVFIQTNMRRRDGSHYAVELRLQLSKGVEGDLVVAVAQDITERKQAEERMLKLAYYDSLTGLPNRQLFSDQLGMMLEAMQLETVNGDKHKLAILFIDLDNFKRINDSLGHTVGDLLLKEVSMRLTACVRQNDIVFRYADPEAEICVSRIGGDEFTIVLNRLNDVEGASVVAKRIISALSRPIRIEGHEFVITPSIGIAIAPIDSDNVESLLKQADTAMYHAKSKGKNNFQYYSSAMNAAGLKRLQLETDLRKALEREELVLFYQPQVDIYTGEINGAEAMIRWQHPTHGLVSPIHFIPLAEEMGLIIPLGEWVLFEACRSFKKWQDQGLNLAKISVNLSSLQFNQPGLIDSIKRALDETGLAPESLELELTESIIMNDAESTIDTLTAFKEMGILLSVDDFGTGYSSLSYLKRFPLDVLKIDKSFVIGVDEDHHNAGIVTAIISMAEHLGLDLIAEGVETHNQLEFLCEHGVNTVQGFLFSKPVCAEAFESLLVQNDFKSHVRGLQSFEEAKLAAS